MVSERSGKALRVIPRGKQRLTVYRAHQVALTGLRHTGMISCRQKKNEKLLKEFGMRTYLWWLYAVLVSFRRRIGDRGGYMIL